jgi:hypothetical protein
MRAILLGLLALGLLAVALPMQASAHGDGCVLHTDALPGSAADFAFCASNCVREDPGDVLADALGGDVPCGLQVTN